MPILQTYGGARGFGRGGLVPFVATGGNQVLTQNGWNYHLFTSSGTFTVASGASALQVLTINGGSSGQGAFISGIFVYGGNGGSGGNASFGPTTSPVSTSFAVTVGGAGGVSSIAPAISATTVSGGSGGAGGQPEAHAIQGGSVALYNTRGTPWSLLSLTQAANAGGGGGGSFTAGQAGNSFFDSTRFPAAGGTSGYSSAVSGAAGGSGGQGQVSPSPGQNAAANSGGGGGGGGGTAYFYEGFVSSSDLRPGGNGGSGFVIVAYPVA